MQLISCDISNFGKLSHEHMDFKGGLNSCIKENGWGKSTLSAFLLAMFFGLSGSGKSKISENEWMRYEPWQGGAFGGTVVFEVKNKRYRMERQFARKGDTFHLYDEATNFECFDYTEKIGEELFGVNKESFMHTVFIGQNSCATYEATDDMNKKLGNITDAMDLGNFDKADTTLKNAVSSLTLRKGNEIDKLNTRESEINVSINAYRDVGTVIDRYSEELKALKEQENECKANDARLKELRKKAAMSQGVMENKASYQRLLSECEEKEAALNVRKSMFPGEVPDEEALDHWKQKATVLSRLDATLNSMRLSEVEHAKYMSLAETFMQKTPSEPELEEYFEKASLLQGKRQALVAHHFTEAESIQFESYDRIFKGDENARESIFYLANRVNDAKELKEALSIRELKEDSLLREEEHAKSKKKTRVISLFLIGICVLLLCVSGYFFVPSYQKICMATGAIGLFLLALAIVLACVHRRVDAYDVYHSETISLKEEREGILSEISDTFTKMGIPYIEGNLLGTLQDLTSKATEYERLREKKMIQANSDAAVEADKLSEEIRLFLQQFSRFVSEEEYMQALSFVKSDFILYNNLREKQASYEASKKEYDAMLESLKKEFATYEFTLEDAPFVEVDAILEKHAEYRKAYEILNDAKERMERFQNEHDMESILKEEASSQSVSLDTVENDQRENDEKLETLKAEIDRIENLLNGYREKLDERIDLEDELIEVRKKREAKNALKDTLSLTRKYLKDAKDSLTMRYTKPLYDGFTKYYGSILPNEGQKYRMDAAANISVEEQGLLRKTETLSFGYQDLIGFCMRLSSADAMFHDAEKPLIILDDPFVNLDNTKFAGAVKLLEELAKSYQVLYFTCRSDRL